MPLFDASAAKDRTGLWVLLNQASVGNDAVPGVIGKSAFEACVLVAAGYVMAKMYRLVCNIGTSRAGPCALSKLICPPFDKGNGSITSLISNKNATVKTNLDKDQTSTSTKGIQQRLVGIPLYVQICTV